MKTFNIQDIINESLLDEAKKIILKESENKEMYQITCEGEPVEVYHTQEEANKHLDIYKKKHPEKEFIIEKVTYDSTSEMIDKLDEMGEKLEGKENKDMKKFKAKNLAEAIMDAHEKGISKIKVGDTSYDVKEMYEQLEEAEEVCDECGYKMEEESDMEENAFVLAADAARDAGKKEFEFPKGSGKMHKVTLKQDIPTEGLNESKKKTLRLNESQLVTLIEKIVKKTKTIKESVPGLEVTKKAQKGSKEENDSYMKDLEKKLKDYSTFDGNDNPEFPKQIGKGEKMAIQNTEEQNDDLDINRGGSMLDLNYDYEPSEKFKERLKMALEGDPKMGNSQDSPNVIKSKTGEKLAKAAEKKKKSIDGEKQISWGHSWMSPEEVITVNESKENKPSILEEELKRMKNIAGYDKKTQ